MEVIISNITDPYFNLAAEEYMMREKGDVFMLWRNSPTVVIGKNQNAYSEINRDFTDKNNISVVRRLTGGGAVFHDLGNVNFTFISDAADDHNIDFLPYMAPMIHALSELGIDACANGRNDIVCDNYKISGNAQCVFETPDKRKRLLHHGTLLFAADLSYLSGALNVSMAKLETKGIKSVRARVANITQLPGYNGSKNVEDFVAALEKFAANEFGSVRTLTPEEIKGINGLADEKYRKWEWNFGISPSHTKIKSERFNYGEVQVSLSAKNAVIEKITISGDFFGTEPITELEKKLIGCRLDRGELEAILCSCNKYIAGATTGDLVNLFLS